MSEEQVAEVVEEAPVVTEESTEEIVSEVPVDAAQSEVPTKEEVKQEVKSMLRSLKIKVDGKEIEKQIDLSDEKELVKLAQMAEMANRRAQETAELKKGQQKRDTELNNFLSILKNDPEQILRQMGIDPSKFAEDVLKKEIAMMEMSPEEKKIKELEEQLKSITENEQKAVKQKREVEQKALEDKYADDFSRDLKEALDSGKLPDSPYIIDKMVKMMNVALTNKIDLNFKDLVPLVQKEHRESLKNAAQGLSVDELLEMLSEEKIKDIMVRKMPAQKKVVPPTMNSVRDSGESKEDVGVKFRKKSSEDFFKNLTHKFAGID